MKKSNFFRVMAIAALALCAVGAANAEALHLAPLFAALGTSPDAVLAGLGADAALCLGDNLPYGPHEGAFYTMERHAEGRGLPGAVLEVRQDQLADAVGVAAWVDRLAPVVSTAAASAGAR